MTEPVSSELPLETPAPGRASDDPAEAARELLATVCAEQFRLWKQGHRVQVEQFLERHPELLRDRDGVVDLVYQEVVLREELGEQPLLDEFLTRFPQFEEELRRQFAFDRGLAEESLLEPRERAPAAGPRSGEDATLEVHIPGYEILELLGGGGGGNVYRARQLRPNRMVALKVMHPTAQVARFRLETEAVGRLQHPHIVQIYEVGEHDSRLFCSLEYVAGGSLAHQLAHTPQHPNYAARLVATLAQAMHAAHQQGIIHRDLKPANVMLTPTGQPKITDFGLARRLDDDAWQSRSGIVMGTPPYMSPEQASGHATQIGPATDVYALGALLYEMLTGRPPFKAASMLETLEQVRSQEAVRPSQLQPKVPRDLETICLKCLQKEPAKRYASAQALADDLQCFLDRQPIKARPVPAWERGLKWARRRPAWAAVIGLSAVLTACLLSGVILGLLWQNQLLQQEGKDHSEVQRLVSDAETAVAIGNWEAAATTLALVQKKIEQNDRFREEYGEQVCALTTLAQAGLAEQLDQKRAAQTYRQFAELRDAARFHGTLATGEGFQANREATRTKTRAALALFGVSPEGSDPVRPGPGFDAQRSREIVESCYELLLVLAEVEATPLPQQADERGQLEKALQLLTRAESLGREGPPSHAWYLRRARYLERLGRRDQAQQERARAERQLPVSAMDHYLLGDEHYKQGHLEQAARSFEQALSCEPRHFWARYFVSLCYLRLGYAPLAQAGLTECLQQNEGFVWLYLVRGFAEVQLKNFPAAEADFDKALSLARGNRDALHVLYANRGVLWFQQGKFEKALLDLQEAIRQKEGYQARVTLAQVHVEWQKRWDRLAQQLRMVTNLDPVTAIFFQSWCRLHGPQRHRDLALEQLSLAIQAEPEVALLYRLRSRLYLGRAEADLDKALRDADQAIVLEEKAGPSRLLARDHAECGRILYRQGKYGAAVRAYDTAIRVEPGYVAAYLGRGQACLQLPTTPDHLLSPLQLGVLAVAGPLPAAPALAIQTPTPYRDAIRSFDEYLQRGGKPVAELYRGRGFARAQLQEYPAAIQDYTHALEMQPDDVATRLARGWAYLSNHEPPMALPDFSEVVRIDQEQGKERGEAYAGRGLARVRLSRQPAQVREAVADAQRAQQLDPEKPPVLYDAACICALAVAALEEPSRTGDRSARELSASCQERAVELLRRLFHLEEAREHRSLWRERIGKEAALDAIRHSPSFVQWERDSGPKR